MLNRVISFFMVIGMFLAFAGCSSLPAKLIEPKVDLQNVDISEPTATEATLIFNFMVENKNPVAIALDQVDYELSLNGKPFTNGILDKGLHVEANSTATIPFPVRVKYSDLFTSVTHLVSFGATPYVFKGTAKMGLLSIPFEKTGEVKLSE